MKQDTWETPGPAGWSPSFCKMIGGGSSNIGAGCLDIDAWNF